MSNDISNATGSTTGSAASSDRRDTEQIYSRGERAIARRVGAGRRTFLRELCGGLAATVATVATGGLHWTASDFGPQANAQEPQAADAAEKLRIVVFGAHPDDAEFKAGGTAAKWARAGHGVKLVSVTNGDIGHWNMAGGPLALRRAAEAAAAAKRLGVASQVLDIHDGELVPSLENRRLITRIIREWKADIVIAHRPWDYHPDHRYVGVLVQDAAFMVTVPFICPDVPPLKKNPVFLYSSDGFQKPYPFQPDVVVALDDIFDRKLEGLHELESQVYEGGAGGSAEQFATVPPASAPEARRQWLRERWELRQSREADRYRAVLAKWYGEERAKTIKFAEAFEICEYGRRPTDAELRRMFPFRGVIRG
jgi:LmbE family N-acetylglucosaminyl deacetylase